MGYMERLGLWGKDHSAFPQFADFLEVIGNRGVGALEMVAMDMKARGMYVCRTLSFAGTHLLQLMPFSCQTLQLVRMSNGLIRVMSTIGTDGWTKTLEWQLET